MANTTQNYPCGESFTGKETDRYIYHDERGIPYLRVIRLESLDASGGKIKKFPQSHYVQQNEFCDENNEANWQSGAPEGPKIPFMLPYLITARESGATIHIGEGEACAAALMNIGLEATCNSEGAIRNAWTPDLNKWFAGCKVAVHVDNDYNGRRHARTILQNLMGVAKQVALVYYTDLPSRGDVKDLIDKLGKDKAREDIDRRVEYAFDLDDLARAPVAESECRREDFCKKWKASKTAVNKDLKRYWADMKIAKREEMECSDDRDPDGRKRALAPAHDAPHTPIWELIDDEFLKVESLEPPMRNISISPALIEVRELAPMHIHTLTALGANAEKELSALEPPKTHMLQPMTESNVRGLIEKHINFYKIAEDANKDLIEIPVSLHSTFVQSYMEYSASMLPRATYVSTMPLVMPNEEPYAGSIKLQRPPYAVLIHCLSWRSSISFAPTTCHASAHQSADASPSR